VLGERAADRLRSWVDTIGWSVLAIALVAILVWQFGGAGA
jgi:hypothetical protein